MNQPKVNPSKIKIYSYLISTVSNIYASIISTKNPASPAKYGFVTLDAKNAINMVLNLYPIFLISARNLLVPLHVIYVGKTFHKCNYVR